VRVQTVGKSGKDKSFARRRNVYDEALLQEHEAASECASVRPAGGTQRGRSQTAVCCAEGWREARRGAEEEQGEKKLQKKIVNREGTV
jgi:hypothetical protein